MPRGAGVRSTGDHHQPGGHEKARDTCRCESRPEAWAADHQPSAFDPIDHMAGRYARQAMRHSPGRISQKLDLEEGRGLMLVMLTLG